MTTACRARSPYRFTGSMQDIEGNAVAAVIDVPGGAPALHRLD